MIGSHVLWYRDKDGNLKSKEFSPTEYELWRFDQDIRASLIRIKEEDEAKELKVQERIRGEDSQESS